MTEGRATWREACPSAARSRSFGRAQRPVHVQVAAVRSLRKSTGLLSGKYNLEHALRMTARAGKQHQPQSRERFSRPLDQAAAASGRGAARASRAWAAISYERT